MLIHAASLTITLKLHYIEVNCSEKKYLYYLWAYRLYAKIVMWLTLFIVPMLYDGWWHRGTTTRF